MSLGSKANGVPPAAAPAAPEPAVASCRKRAGTNVQPRKSACAPAPCRPALEGLDGAGPRALAGTGAAPAWAASLLALAGLAGGAEGGPPFAMEPALTARSGLSGSGSKAAFNVAWQREEEALWGR